MSARQLARLRALIEEKKRTAELAAVDDHSDQEEEEEDFDQPNRVSFAALNGSDSEEEETTSEEELRSSKDEVVIERAIEKKQSKEEVDKEENAYLDSLVASAKEYRVIDSSIASDSVSDSNYINIGDILQINARKLNDKEESNSRFGGNAENEAALGRGQRQRQRQIRRVTASTGISANSSIFITPSPDNVRPPSILGGGFAFHEVETPFNFDKGSLVHLDNTAVFYSIESSAEYKHLVEEYKSYKSTYLTQDIGQMAIQFYQKHSYLLHVAYDLCQIMLMYKNAESVFEILRQCLYIIEKAVGPRFDFTSGKARFLYSEEDNRVIYKTYRLYIQMCLRKACFDTALNTSLILFSFFPQLDPTGTLLLIPFLAHSSKRYSTIQRIGTSGIAIGPLPLLMLPNWGFDYGLALYRLGERDKAKEQIKDSLRRWPMMPRIMTEYAKSSLYIPTYVKEVLMYAEVPSDKNMQLMLEIFCQRESQLWGISEVWTLLMECYGEIIKDRTEEEWKDEWKEMEGIFITLQDYFTDVENVSDIDDNLFTVRPEDYLDDLPTVDMNEIMGDLREQQLEQQLEQQIAGMRVPNNVPANHNLFQLFMEALNPNMNAAELNDDDVAALQEQMGEMLQGNMQFQQNEQGEGEWEQNWDSDENIVECVVCFIY